MEAPRRSETSVNTYPRIAYNEPVSNERSE